MLFMEKLEVDYSIFKRVEHFFLSMRLRDKKGWTQRVGLANILLAKGLVASILLDA